MELQNPSKLRDRIQGLPPPLVGAPSITKYAKPQLFERVMKVSLFIAASSLFSLWTRLFTL